MAEQAYTVVSDSETIGEDKSSTPFPEIAIGVDIGTSQCSVACWNGSQVEVLKNTRNQKMMRSYVTFKDETPTGGVNNLLSHEYEVLSGAAIFNMKRLIGRVDTDSVVHGSKNLPFLVQTLDIGVRPFIAALVNNMWRSTTPEEVLAIFLVELRAMAEVQLKRPVRNVVLTIPVSFSRFQITRIERACAMAELHVLRLMPEPTAVALLYAQHQQVYVHENMGSGSEKIVIQCLHDAKVEIGNLNDVILVGGCSHIPKVTNLVKGVCKRQEIYAGMNTLEAAVCGAALEGAVASGISDPFGSLDLLTIQATPLSIGVRADGNCFVPVILKNTAMPVRKELVFTTVHDNQLEALIVVYEGDEKVVEKNHMLGYFKITGIPPAPKGNPEITICMDIDASNVLRVLAGVVMPGARTPVNPFMEVRMPTVDDGHGWCGEALLRTYQKNLDVTILQKNKLH